MQIWQERHGRLAHSFRLRTVSDRQERDSANVVPVLLRFRVPFSSFENCFAALDDSRNWLGWALRPAKGNEDRKGLAEWRRGERPDRD
jgi:hypothetical protein